MISEIPPLLMFATGVAASLLGLAVVVAAIRLARGPSIADRLVALDLVASLCLCLLVAMAVRFQLPALIDVGMALVVLTFIGTLAVARHLEEEDRS